MGASSTHPFMNARTTPAEQHEKVRTIIFPSAEEAAKSLAAEVKALIEERNAAGKPAVLGMATGSTPVPFYRELIRLHREEGLSFKNVITFNLDEYYGLNREHRESYWRFMQDQLFSHIDIPLENINLPDGMVPMDKVFEHCADYERRIDAAGGVDLQILGIGRTGHIGFNEPGSSRESLTRLVPLDRVTRADAAPDFSGEENVPRFAITMGVGTILRARKVVLMSWGENKAEITAKAIEGPETEQISASFLQSHPHARFMINEGAARSLTRVRLPWLVGQAKWTRDETRRAVVWLALKEKKPILKLVDEEYNEHGMAELLTKSGGKAYDLNIDIFNHQQHSITGWPGGKEEKDDSRRPERALPFPKTCLILAPEPQDEVLGMGGTIERLVRQGHKVHVAHLTSGDLRVTDDEARRFARVLLETAREEAGHDPDGWQKQILYAEKLRDGIIAKGPFGAPSDELRRLKARIRLGEARDAVRSLGVTLECMHFTDLPFYRRGRYRQFVLTEEDVNLMGALIDAVQPHQVYVTGKLADPTSVQGMVWKAFRQAAEEPSRAAWRSTCSVWLYRGHQKEYAPHEIEMAVPMSPDQTARKVAAVQKFSTHTLPELLDGERNRETARLYDSLGMAEYEAIEAFRRWKV